MTTFTLTITLGNDAMQTGEDVARALHSAAYHIEQHDSGRAIYDDNGNRVGSFGYSEPESAEVIAERLTAGAPWAEYEDETEGVRSLILDAVRIARGEA